MTRRDTGTTERQNPMTDNHSPLTGRLRAGGPGDLLCVQLPRHVKLYTHDKDETTRPRFVQVESATFSSDMNSYRLVTVTGEVFVLRGDERITIIEQTAAEAAATQTSQSSTRLTVVPDGDTDKE